MNTYESNYVNTLLEGVMEEMNEPIYVLYLLRESARELKIASPQLSGQIHDYLVNGF